MLTAELVSTPTPDLSQLDRIDWTRELWREAFSMARRMVKVRPGHSTGESLTWYFDHGFRRFGYAALPLVRAAGWCAFNERLVTKAATGTREELARQGMLTRCVRLERAPRGGWSWAWTHDPLAAVNLNRGHRVHLARQRRAARAVAHEMARERRRLAAETVEERYTLTAAGRAALAAAEAARA
jgi:hypothetical protein